MEEERSGSLPLRRSPYTTLRVQHHIEGESLAIQHEKDNADINKIVRNFARTGQFPIDAVSQGEAQYGDVSEISHLGPDQLAAKAEEIHERLQSAEEDALLRAAALQEDQAVLQQLQDESQPGAPSYEPPSQQDVPGHVDSS